MEATGQGPIEGARIRLEAPGKATVYTGAATQGQGSLTTLSQVCAAELGIEVDDVTVIAGDTSMISKGAGAFASRIATVAGAAVFMSCKQLRERLLEQAAEALEARPQDVEFIDGRFRVRGSPQRAVGIASLVSASESLEETAYYEPLTEAWSSGAQAVIVDVEPLTGEVRILRYAAIHDCGTILNPTIVEGQMMGGLAHGIGETLYERMVYDENGQYLSASFMDFIMPSACEIPSVDLLHQETPSPLSPLGVKGAGEGGTLGVCGALIGAVENALEPLGIRIRSSPIRCDALARAIKQAMDGGEAVTV